MTHDQESAAPAPPPRPYKRKVANIFIHKPMQREFILVVIALLIVSTLAIGYVIHSTLADASAGGGFRFGKISGNEIITEVRYDLVVRVTLILIMTMMMIAAFGLFFLHRVAGPVYRFHQVFLKINDGQMPHPVRLREGDFFTDTAEEINRLVRRLEFEHNKRKVLLEKIEALLRSGTGSPGGALQEIQSLLKREPEE